MIAGDQALATNRALLNVATGPMLLSCLHTATWTRSLCRPPVMEFTAVLNWMVDFAFDEIAHVSQLSGTNFQNVTLIRLFG